MISLIPRKQHRQRYLLKRAGGRRPRWGRQHPEQQGRILLALVGTVFLGVSPRSLLSQHNVRFSSVDAATPGLVLALGISFLPVTQSSCIC